MKRITLIALLLVASVTMAHSQVLISLLFGDKLNSPTLKFGLEGGVNMSTISNVGAQKMLTNWNLGFYFDFWLKQETPWYLHTGVLVKSTMGARDKEYLPIGDDDLDSLFSLGTVDRRINYFNVPILLRYQFKNRIFIEAGPMLSLLYKAADVYNSTYEDNDLSFVYDIKSNANRLDVGVEGGVGYFLKDRNGVNIGFRYYQGLRNIPSANPDKKQLNSSYFIFASIPIGAGEKGQAKQAAAKAKREAKKAAKAAEKEEKKK